MSEQAELFDLWKEAVGLRCYDTKEQCDRIFSPIDRDGEWQSYVVEVEPVTGTVIE